MSRTEKRIGLVVFVCFAVRTGVAVDDEWTHAGPVGVAAIVVALVALVGLLVYAIERRSNAATGVAMGLFLVATVLGPEFIALASDAESGDWIMIPVLLLVAIVVYPIYRWRFRREVHVEPTSEQMHAAAADARARQRGLPSSRRRGRR